MEFETILCLCGHDSQFELATKQKKAPVDTEAVNEMTRLQHHHWRSSYSRREYP